jgi:hypothetical protein
MPKMERTVYEEYCREQRGRADDHLAEFLETSTDYSLDGEQPDWLKGTHLVTFGTYRGQPAVFKYYDGDSRKGDEKRALELFAPTGLVPRIFAETDMMLVMERLPGLTMYEMEKDLTPAERNQLYYRLGEAVAKIVETAPGREEATRVGRTFRAADQRDLYSTSYNDLTVLYREAGTTPFFDITLARAWRVLRDRDVPHKETLTRSLKALQRNRDAILSWPGFVQMDDFHTNNIMTDGRNIRGFIDLEMTRSGNEVLLLGAALGNICHWPERWPSFRRGYEGAQGSPMDDSMLRLIQITAPFSVWIRFTWYWDSDELPWWAKEMDLRTSSVRGIMEIMQALEKIEL